MKKIWKWILVIVLTPFILFTIITLLFYFPPFQNWVANKVASVASEKTGMEISVGHVSLEFPLDLAVENFKMIEQNDSLPQVKDTVTDASKLVARIQLLPLLKSQVEVDELRLQQVKLNTTHFIPDVRIKGVVGELSLVSHNIDLTKETLRLNDAQLLNSQLNVVLSDTVPPDTTPSKNFWKLFIDQVHVQKSGVTVHMPGDTIQVKAYLVDALAQKGFLDLKKSIYQVGQLDVQDGHVQYDNRFKVHTQGLDVNHIDLNNLQLGVDSFYYQAPLLRLKMRKASFREKSGIILSKFTGPLMLDSTKILLPELELRTPESSLQANVALDLNTFDDKNPGKLHAIVHGTFGKQDLMRFMGSMPVAFRKGYPNELLTINGTVDGNMKKVNLYGLNIKLPSAFNIQTTGWLKRLDNIDRLQAHLQLDAKTYRMGFVTNMLDKSLTSILNIPYGIHINGLFDMASKQISTRFIAKQGGGSVNADAAISLKTMTYRANLRASRFPVQHFIPNQGLHPFTGYITARGSGTEFLSPRTRLYAKATVQKFQYGGYNLDHINAVAHLGNGKIHADINSKNNLLDGIISLDALLNLKHIKGTFTADIRKADLYHLHLVKSPLVTSLCGHVDLSTNLKDYYQVQGLVSDITFREGKKSLRPDDIVMDVLTRRDTTHAVIDCGDFHLNMNAQGGYQRLMNLGNRLMVEAQRQLKNRTIDQLRLRRQLPYAHIYLKSGKENFFIKALSRYGYKFKMADIQLESSPILGLNGNLAIDSLIADSVQLDTLRLALRSDSSTIYYEGMVRNGPTNPQYVFKALFDGRINTTGTSLVAKIFDRDNRLGFDLGLNASMEHKGIKVSIFGDDPVLGYKKFGYNSDNYVFLGDDRRLSANMVLKSDDGMGIQLYTDDENSEALQDLTVGITKLDLHNLLAVIPYMPDISGIANGDFHIIQTKDKLSVSSSVTVDQMSYEHCSMGNVGTEFVYMPKADGTHVVDGILLSEGNEVGILKGSYQSMGEGYLDAELTMDRLPVSMINGFIPERIVGLRGYGDGSLSIKGSLSRPDVNGEIYLDSCYLYSDPYGVEMRFANDPVRIVGSNLLFENFEMFANNNNSLNISGNLDFSNLDRMMMDVRMRAENLQLINAKENVRSMAYGKAFVNFYGMMNGPVSNLKMRGKLDVLGNTDMTYVLKESELATDNQMDDLIKFTNFKDSIPETVEKPKLEGLDMSMSISVDESAHIHCTLNEDKTNYIDLQGGGDLRMSYNPIDELTLTGRYTLNSGEMKYSLPVIPLKTFHIQEGSFIEFTGDVMNPTLNITATENVKSNVASSSGDEHTVDFICGVKLTKTLAKPGVQFIIEAPNDMTVQDELNTLTEEGRSKVAITMLASGMYLSDGNTTSFSMNSALTSFLNSQINNITGTALRSMGLDLGMSVDNTTNSAGLVHTDYSFKFSKRFLNNRLSVIVGGKVSTGANMDQSGSQNNFFDDVELQYRLGTASSKYVTLFYKNNVYDWLEGQIGEYGVGFLWRRKLNSFKDLLRFKSEPNTNMMMPNRKDTVKIKLDNHEAK